MYQNNYKSRPIKWDTSQVFKTGSIYKNQTNLSLTSKRKVILLYQDSEKAFDKTQYLLTRMKEKPDRVAHNYFQV